MADPITNAQFAQSLFSPMVELAQRHGEARNQLALLALRRQQALEDQATNANLQRELTNLVSDRTLQVERERSNRAEQIASAATTRAEGREDALLKRTVQREARRKYSEYAALAADAGESPKSFDSFGKEPDDAINEITSEMSRLQGKQNDAAFGGLVAGYRRRAKALNTMAQVSPEEEKLISTKVLGAMVPEDTKEESWTKALSAFARGSERIGLELLGPKDRAAYEAQRAGGLQSLRIIRMKDPAYINAAREVSQMQEAIVNASFKNPKWAKALGQIDESESDDAAAQAKPITIDSFIRAAAPAKKAASLETSSPAPAAAGENDYGGVLGYIAPAKKLWEGARQLDRDVTLYAPGTLAQMVGGDRLVSELGLDQGDVMALRAKRAWLTHGPWIKATGNALYEKAINSILGRKKPESAPAQ